MKREKEKWFRNKGQITKSASKKWTSEFASDEKETTTALCRERKRTQARRRGDSTFFGEAIQVQHTERCLQSSMYYCDHKAIEKAKKERNSPSNTQSIVNSAGKWTDKVGQKQSKRLEGKERGEWEKEKNVNYKKELNWTGNAENGKRESEKENEARKSSQQKKLPSLACALALFAFRRENRKRTDIQSHTEVFFY